MLAYFVFVCRVMYPGTFIYNRTVLLNRILFHPCVGRCRFARLFSRGWCGGGPFLATQQCFLFVRGPCTVLSFATATQHFKTIDQENDTEKQKDDPTPRGKLIDLKRFNRQKSRKDHEQPRPKRILEECETRHCVQALKHRPKR